MLWALTKEDAMVIRCGCLAVTVVLAGALSPLHAQGQFRAGAARVDITPAKDAALPLAGYAGRTDGFKDIHDRLYARAIVVGDGSATAAIVTCDLIGLNEALWQRIQARVSAEIGILPDHLLLAGTHTHGAPNITARANGWILRIEGCLIVHSALTVCEGVGESGSSYPCCNHL